jgi:hypothetical protein
MVVFWTRFAARSKWVRREYETFLAQFPERPLVPVLGDTTRRPRKLRARQHADLFPLINELLATARELENTGVGKREIRRVLLKRLNEAGVELPDRQRRRLLGLFGVVGIATAPLHLLRVVRDRAVEQVTAVSSAYYYTAGVSALAGGAICHTLTGGGDRLLAPDLFPVQVKVDQSGTGACDAEGMICVSMSRSDIFDVDDKFFGYSTPTCSARVVKGLSNCQRDFATDYALQGVVVRRSPDAEEGVQDLSGTDFFCLGKGKGKDGIYEFANCVKP